MKKVFLLLTLISFSSILIAGSNTATLTCKSESGRTEFNALLQDIIGGLVKADFIIDGSEINFNSECENHTVFDPENKVFTISLQGISKDKKYIHLQFWAIPSSFKVLKGERFHQIYEFEAIIKGTEPRENKSLNSPDIKLNCRLEYQI